MCYFAVFTAWTLERNALIQRLFRYSDYIPNPYCFRHIGICTLNITRCKGSRSITAFLPSAFSISSISVLTVTRARFAEVINIVAGAFVDCRNGPSIISSIYVKSRIILRRHKQVLICRLRSAGRIYELPNRAFASARKPWKISGRSSLCRKEMICMQISSPAFLSLRKVISENQRCHLRRRALFYCCRKTLELEQTQLLCALLFCGFEQCNSSVYFTSA